MDAHTCNPSTLKVEVGVQYHYHQEVQYRRVVVVHAFNPSTDSQGYTQKPCLKKPQKKKKKQINLAVVVHPFYPTTSTQG